MDRVPRSEIYLHVCLTALTTGLDVVCLLNVALCATDAKLDILTMYPQFRRRAYESQALAVDEWVTSFELAPH